MPRALLRLVCVFLGVACAQAASPLAVLRIGRVDYVRATDVAARFDLRLRWVAANQLELSDKAHQIELLSDKLVAHVDGLRVDLGEPTVTHGGQLYLSKTDFEKRLTPMLRPGWGGPPPPPPHIIVLDPGHGGGDPGMQNSRLKMNEKTYTLAVALRLRKLLETAGYKVVMTRTEDRALSPIKETDLRDRGEMAVLAHADLFLSIHFNSSYPDTRTHGTEVYTFPPEFQPSTESWQTRKDDSFSEVAPANRNDHWSVVLAHAVHRQFLDGVHTEDRGEKLKHLGVLRLLNCPGMLVEAAFLSNDAEAARVETTAFQEEMAEALAAGIHAYVAELDSLRPLGSATPAAVPAALQPPKRPS